jgi:hypothetical protein
LICSQSLDFTAFDRIINIEKRPYKSHKSLEIKAFSHTYFSTLDINTTHSTCPVKGNISTGVISLTR